MRVLIAGAGGQVGQALVATAPDDVEVCALLRQHLDIADPASIKAAIARFAPTHVINAAAYTAVDHAEVDEEEVFRINARGVVHLARACAARGVRLVHYSTDFVFDGRQSQPYSIDAQPAPLNVYGRSKLAGEEAAVTDSENLVLRTAWVYAAGGQNFVRTMLALLRDRGEVRVVADQVGTPTHALSLARATWALIGQGARGLHHFTDAGLGSWYDFAVAIQEEALELGLLERASRIIPIATREYPVRALRPSYSVLNKSQTWALLGEPARHWRVELRDMLHALKETLDG